MEPNPWGSQGRARAVRWVSLRCGQSPGHQTPSICHLTLLWRQVRAASDPCLATRQLQAAGSPGDDRPRVRPGGRHRAAVDAAPSNAGQTAPVASLSPTGQRGEVGARTRVHPSGSRKQRAPDVCAEFQSFVQHRRSHLSLSACSLCLQKAGLTPYLTGPPETLFTPMVFPVLT